MLIYMENTIKFYWNYREKGTLAAAGKIVALSDILLYRETICQ